MHKLLVLLSLFLIVTIGSGCAAVKGSRESVEGLHWTWEEIDHPPFPSGGDE